MEPNEVKEMTAITDSRVQLRLVDTNTEQLTHLPLDKMAAISQTIFSDAYSWMKHFVFWLKFPRIFS